MNENYLIKSVRRVSKNLLSKYEILAVPLFSFGLVTAQKFTGKLSRTVLPASNKEASICLSLRHTRKILLSISINPLLLNLIP
jgi:hypothetical protein